MADNSIPKSERTFKKRTRRGFVPPFCEIEGCGRKYYAKGCCLLHYTRLANGLDPKARTRFDPNEIIVNGDTAEILLYDRHGNEKARAIIDACDVPKVGGMKWCRTKSNKSKTYYVINTNTGIHLHDVIMPAPEGMIVDHKDGDGLNNRRCNLRAATHADNMHNSRGQKGTSRFKGVGLYKPTKRWRASIATHHLGYYRNEEDAARAYDKAAKEMFGEFARLNIS